MKPEVDCGVYAWMFTKRQRTAIDHACLRATDSNHPRFLARSATWQTLLTVNK